MKNRTKLILTLILALNVFFVRSQNIQFKVYDDGTYDISGTSVKITNCYPAIDDILIKPVSVRILSKDHQQIIQYNLGKSKIEITLGYDQGTATIQTNIIGESIKASFIAPIQSAIVIGANRIYRTPTQIAGGGGIKDWPADGWENASCGNLTGLIPENGSTMVISSRNFSKFVSYTNCRPRNSNGGKKVVDVLFNTEKVPVNSIPTVYISEGPSAFAAMNNEAKEIANLAGVKNEKPQSYHWCSWYYAYYYLTDKMLSEYLQGFKTVSPQIHIQTIQIDAGYFPHAGDWLEPSEKFPKGIENSVKEIISYNYKAGIWIGPYMVGNRSKLYKQHPDWILHNEDGSPVINMQMYGENRLWGAMDEEIYTLDTSNPDAMEYLRQVFRAFRKMGITFFKTDFMLYGSTSSEKLKRYTPGKTSLEYQHDFFNMIRQEIGQDSYWLGCIAPYVAMIGYVDGMRISGDISADWKHSNNMFDESIGCQHINNIWWQNDPDAIILREKYSHLSFAETQSMALWMGMLGGVINTSDLFHEIPQNNVQLFRFLEPSDIKITSEMPFIDKKSAFVIQAKNFKDRNAWAVLFVNRENEPKSQNYSIKSLVGINGGTCFDWQLKGAVNLGEKQNITIELQPHESKLIYISSDGKSPEGINLAGKSGTK